MKSIIAHLFAALLLTSTVLLTACATTGSASAPPLDPKQADAVVQVKGMSCPQCANSIKLLMDGMDEISDSRVDLGDGRVFIAFAPDKTLSEAQIIDLVDRAGFTAGEVTYLKKGTN